jgi:hypothetical protein
MFKGSANTGRAGQIGLLSGNLARVVAACAGTRSRSVRGVGLSSCGLAAPGRKLPSQITVRAIPGKPLVARARLDALQEMCPAAAEGADARWRSRIAGGHPGHRSVGVRSGPGDVRGGHVGPRPSRVG